MESIVCTWYKTTDGQYGIMIVLFHSRVVWVYPTDNKLVKLGNRGPLQEQKSKDCEIFFQKSVRNSLMAE